LRHIPSKLAASGAAVAILFAAIAAPLTAAPATQSAVDEVALYATSAPSTNAIAASTSTLTDAEIQDILFMREEEKLARDVYMTLADVWGTPIFTNIAGAESMHMSSIETLITRYGLDDPVDENPVGVFVNPTLQTMYDDLVATGSQSLINALEVGALIEEVDIKDLIDSIAETEASDVLRVWEQLLSGSQNHLKAFTSQLAAQGIDYESTVLDAGTYDQMLSEAGQSNGAQGNEAGRQGGRGDRDDGGRQGGPGHGRNG
ncbi:MAG: DUF2202 domain-containing protein, partial [Actinomycetia bacterium]|nr:DUF2202 domain-containing protein [Actinomycetes bacterium]